MQEGTFVGMRPAGHNALRFEVRKLEKGLCLKVDLGQKVSCQSLPR